MSEKQRVHIVCASIRLANLQEDYDGRGLLRFQSLVVDTIGVRIILLFDAVYNRCYNMLTYLLKAGDVQCRRITSASICCRIEATKLFAYR